MYSTGKFAILLVIIFAWGSCLFEGPTQTEENAEVGLPEKFLLFPSCCEGVMWCECECVCIY